MQRVAEYVDRVAARHAGWASSLSSGPLKPSHAMLAGILALVLLALAGNSWVRHQQLEVWQMSPDITHIEGAPSFSTADAPYFLRLAEEFMKDEGDRDIEGGVLANDGLLLPKVIATISEDNSLPSLLTAGNHVVFFSVVLAALAVVICFGAAGYWLEGAVAGLGGGLSIAFLVRSSVGRIDTDQMNLAFMHLMFALVILAGRAKSRLHVIAWCVRAGICARLFMSWYGKAELILMAAIALFWLLSCLQRNLVTAIAGTLIFLLLANISYFNPFATSYLQDRLSFDQFLFPNTLMTISEVQRVPIFQILKNAAGSIEMGLVCLVGLFLFLLRHPVIAVAMGPLVLFGLLNFVLGNRAIFYAAPIMWFGAAFLMTTIARFIATSLSETDVTVGRERIASMSAAALGMIVAWANSPTDYVPHPSFPKPVVEGLMSLKTTTDPENSIAVTWWDYGYASAFLNGLPTFHDGGSQTKPSTYFVARAFLDSDQTESIGNLKFLAKDGLKRLSEEGSFATVAAQFADAVNAPSKDLYLVVTDQMTRWTASMSQIGNWDIDTGTPIEPRGNSHGQVIFYEKMNCRLAGYPQKLSCMKGTFDLEQGLINGVPALSGWAHTQDGLLVRRGSFDHDGDFAVQITQIGNRISAYLLHRQLYESTFNELYHLGQIDHPSISLHYDDYPHIRIYKVAGTPDS